MKAPHHHLRRIDHAVVQSRNVTRLESAGPVRIFQLTSETQLTVGDPTDCVEAILNVTSQERTVSQVFDRLSLCVQHSLQLLDDVVAMGQEKLEHLDVRLKGHVGAATLTVGY
jgi:hypothetical protein